MVVHTSPPAISVFDKLTWVVCTKPQLLTLAVALRPIPREKWRESIKPQTA